MAEKDLAKQLTDLQNQEGKLDLELNNQPDNSKYRPNKRRRAIRRQVYARYYELRDDPRRKEAEQDWEIADREYGMVTDEIDPDDWKSHLQLPDAFAAIQTQAQETIERKSRPRLAGVEESDEPIEEFGNAVLNHNMDETGYDYQAFLSKLSASIRGTSFRLNYWRTEKRVVKLPKSVGDDGEIVYEETEITDFDDDYTEWKPAEYIYVDEKAMHINDAVDMVEREILNIDEFHRIYGNKPGFFDTEFVVAGGDMGGRGNIFQLPKDITAQDVEILHYHNRSIDAYWCVANNVTIYDSPLPSMHKELPLVVDYQYRIPGQFWGFGIPKVMHHLSEERKSIRNLNMDRQKIIVAGAFLHNNSFDIDEEETVLEPGRMISVDTNGQPVSQAIQQVQMNDVGPGYFKTEEILLEDMRRASGIDDRVTVSNSATTATQAAIVKESTLKRINLISITNEMDTLIRLGRIKWSNIQFFYGTPRLQKITEENDERQEKVYRTISVKDKKFSVVSENGKKKLKMEDIKGNSALSLKPEFNRYLDKSFNIVVDAASYTPPSKAIDQTKKQELFSLLLSNPATIATMDIKGATSDILKTFNVNPDTWMKDRGISAKDMMMLAESENMVMAAGQPLDGTEGASEDHTLVHLMYTKTQEFAELPVANQQLIMDHIMQEHDNNPATGASADLMGAYGLTPSPDGSGGEAPLGNGTGEVAPLSISGQTTEPQPQVADLQATNFANPE